MTTKQEIQTMTKEELTSSLTKMLEDLKKFALLKSAGKLTQTHQIIETKKKIAFIKMRLASL